MQSRSFVVGVAIFTHNIPAPTLITFDRQVMSSPRPSRFSLGCNVEKLEGGLGTRLDQVRLCWIYNLISHSRSSYRFTISHSCSRRTEIHHDACVASRRGVAIMTSFFISCRRAECPTVSKVLKLCQKYCIIINSEITLSPLQGRRTPQTYCCKLIFCHHVAICHIDFVSHLLLYVSDVLM